MRIVLIMLSAMLMAACSGAPTKYASENKHLSAPQADIIFIGDNIVTMDPANSEFEADFSNQSPSSNSNKAVAIKEGKIIYLGNPFDVFKLKGNKTRVIHLGDRALLPGLIDTHGHFTSVAKFINLANLSSPPVGTVTNIDELVKQLTDYSESQTASDNVDVSEGDSEKDSDSDNDSEDDNQNKASSQWLVGYGYDDSLLEERRHPNKFDLDRVSDTRPVAIIHVSYHFVAVNSVALDLLGITQQRVDPKGGKFRRVGATKEPNGVLEEAAGYIALHAISNIDQASYKKLLRDSAFHYAQNGITTAQDGAIGSSEIALLKQMAEEEALPIDLNLYQTLFAQQPEAIETLAIDEDYKRGIKLAGAKFIIDGSPQGRTAWMTEPYEVVESTPSNDAEQKEYRGYSSIDADFYQKALARLLARNIPTLSHANGDAAIDLMLDSIEQSLAALPAQDGQPDHRAVIIHAQLMRLDQLEKAKELGVIPSFFSAHPFFWGDWHKLNFGEQRARNISPTRWATDLDIAYTIHNDAPVIPADMMRLLWVTVNRTTRSGEVLGESQRSTAYEALQAITINAAHQYFEEQQKGSISVGKRADLVIVEKNPLTVDSQALKDIRILETFVRGQSIFVELDQPADLTANQSANQSANQNPND